MAVTQPVASAPEGSWSGGVRAWQVMSWGWGPMDSACRKQLGKHLADGKHAVRSSSSNCHRDCH